MVDQPSIRISPVQRVISRVRELHSVPRLDGSPYWTHPLRCHDFLVSRWKGVPLECQIAMLFHDTLEDIENGEVIIRETLEQPAIAHAELDIDRIIELIENVTTPQGVPKVQAIEIVERRFEARQVEPEAYLLKAVDIMDNTNDILNCVFRLPGNPDVQKHMSKSLMDKYYNYGNAMRNGLRGNRNVWNEQREAMGGVLAYVLKVVFINLCRMDEITSGRDPVYGKGLSRFWPEH